MKIIEKRKNNNRIQTILFVFVLTLYSHISTASNCETDYSKCSILKTITGEEIEPSGVVWVEGLDLAIGVSDSRNKAPGYEIFSFDPMTSNEIIIVKPMLTEDQSNKFQLDDLEGITQVNGEFFVMSSLSLDKHFNHPEDRWSRQQALRFRIRKDASGNFGVAYAKKISSKMRPDLRSWIITNPNPDWMAENLIGRAEHGGINVEGLASTKEGNLIIGFRGPIISSDQNMKVPLLVFSPQGPNLAPLFKEWKHIEMNCSGSECDHGIRGIERISDDNKFIVILGHKGSKHDQLSLILWDMDTGKVKQLGDLPKRFVGEGITIIKQTSKNITLLIVDDLEGRFMIKKVSL